jgi:hypothetical protein
MMRRLGVLALGAVVASCGGGGGGSAAPPESKATFNVSTTSVTYNVESPASPEPTVQKITGSVTGDLSGLTGTLYIVIDVAGNGILGVPVELSPDQSTGTASVLVKSPQTMGPGTHQATLTIRACMNDARCNSGQLNGSPRTVNVTYTIGSSLQRDGVYPSVVAADTPGSVVIRQQSIGTTVTSVTFGGVPATSFTQVSNNEVKASYPALGAGAKTIAFNGAVLPFNLSAVSVPAFPAATLTYASHAYTVSSPLYDLERQRLMFVHQPPNGLSPQLVIYTYSAGQWSAPSLTTIDSLRSIALDARTSTLIALRKYVLEERSAADLSIVRSVPTPIADSFFFMNRLALSNDGNFVVLQDVNGTGPPPVLIYSTTKHTFWNLGNNSGISQGVPTATADGSRIVIGATSYDNHVREYRGSTGVLSPQSVDMFSDERHLAVDATGTRIALTNSNASRVFDGNYTLLGTLPLETQAVVVNSTGTRAYTYDTSGMLRKFDISASANGGTLNELGVGQQLEIVSKSVSQLTVQPARMFITPDDKTVFVVGADAVAVQPVTP